MIVSFRREAILSEERKNRRVAGGTAGAAQEARELAKKEHAMLRNKQRFESRIERMAVDGRSAEEVLSTIANLSTYKQHDRVKSGEMLAQALMTKQHVYEEELVAVKREELSALGNKDQDLADRCRLLKAHLASTLQLLDNGIMILSAPDTLWVFDPLHPWRVSALGLIRSKTFQQSINILLLCSTVLLAMERRDIQLQERNALDLVNLALNLVFTGEFLLKAFALSFESYLKDPLNRLDFVIVVFGIVDITLTLMEPPLIKPALMPPSDTAIFGVLRILRIVKTMRPLRLILFRIERVRILVNAMKESIAPLQLAASIALILVFILGVFGQQLLSGRMSGCSDASIYFRQDCTGIDDQGLGRRWRPREFNCDWIGDSVVLMFTAISKDRCV
jgi:hypothetical protein